MEYNDAYSLSKEAVDETVFADRGVLAAYNELLSTGSCDYVQEIVFEIEDDVRTWAEDLDEEDLAEIEENGSTLLAAALDVVDGERVEAAMARIREAAAEEGVSL